MRSRIIKNFVRDIFNDTYDFYACTFDSKTDHGARRGKFKPLPLKPDKGKHVAPRTPRLQDFPRYFKEPETKVVFSTAKRNDNIAAINPVPTHVVEESTS